MYVNKTLNLSKCWFCSVFSSTNCTLCTIRYFKIPTAKLWKSQLLREHPFNLKGAMFFWGIFFLSADFKGKKFLSLTWTEKHILLHVGLCALKNIVFIEKK